MPIKRPRTEKDVLFNIIMLHGICYIAAYRNLLVCACICAATCHEVFD